MAINKVVYGNQMLIDLTNDTVAAAKMLSGTTAHGANGEAITGNIVSKAAATYVPTTTDQTITANQYLSGVQTIKGDANLVSGNIISGVSIFGVSGAAPVYTFMTEEEIWTAVTSGWGTNSVMTTAQIQSAVDNGWR